MQFLQNITQSSEAVAKRGSVKKVLLEISQNSQEDTCARVSLLIKSYFNKGFIKKETLAQVFSCEFCEIFKNTFFYRIPPLAASVLNPCGKLFWDLPHITFQNSNWLVSFLISFPYTSVDIEIT